MIHQSGETLRVEGALTIETVPDLVNAIEGYFDQGARKIDLKLVTDVDSAAVALLLEWRRQAISCDVTLAFLNLPEVLRNLVNLYGVSSMIQCTPS